MRVSKINLDYRVAPDPIMDVNIVAILGEHATYFSPISLHSMEATIEDFLQKKVDIPEYKSILHLSDAHKSSKKFLEIMQNYE